MFHRLLFPILFLVMPLTAAAQSERLQPLFDALRLPEVLEIIRTEGIEHAGVIEADMFPDAGGDAWRKEVTRIYDIPRMEALMAEGFGQAPDAGVLDRMTAFFTSGLGRRITDLEIAARAAMLDDTVEEAAKDSFQILQADDQNRAALLEDFVDINDLIDANVVGGLNANYAFYRGLQDGEAFEQAMTEDQILRDVWNQEGEIRDSTRDWVFAYLALAYRKLEDAELQEYVNLSRTSEGRAFNRTLFEAFDVLFYDVSYALGRAAGRMMSAEDI